MNQHKKIIIILSILAATMFSFTFALIPFYNVLCKLTGINAKIRLIAEQNNFAPPVTNRTITIQFIANNHASLPWDFYPKKISLAIHPDETAKMIFIVKNKTSHAMTVQAIPSITPGIAVSYFHKIACFCFDKQTVAAGETKEMPVVFRVDKKLPLEISVITLAYTLFDVTKKESHYE